MVSKNRCKICDGTIDKGACGTAYTIITTIDDRANDPAKFSKKRIYLCDEHSIDLDLWIHEQVMLE